MSAVFKTVDFVSTADFTISVGREGRISGSNTRKIQFVAILHFIQMGFADIEPYRLVGITFSIANLDEVAFIGVLLYAFIGLPIQIYFENTAWAG